ncbi:MAG: GHKL domain-containing protein [Luteitalea sp.]|nr:GHKL domain-containing protein [Luteitalea sp.]
MKRDWLTAWRQRLMVGVAIAVAIALVTLAVVGYRATREWQRSSARLVERRAEESAELLVTALTRDMRGAQALVLASRDWNPLSVTSLTDISDHVAAAFARYPYPESFFEWHEGSDQSMVFFNRADRPPAWMPKELRADRYPVVLVTEPAVATTLADRIRQDAKVGRRYSVFDVTLARERYQVVARLQYDEPFRERLESIFGYTVNLRWVRRSYFSEITAEVARIGNRGVDLDLAVLDEHGSLIAGSANAVPATRRSFPLLFFDPTTSAVDPPADLAVRTWQVRVSSANDPTLVWATRSANWTLGVMTAAATGLGVSLIFGFYAARASVMLAEVRSDFVSSVTHELKTPLATIRAVGHTLIRGRVTGPDALREYAQLLVQEAKRLTRLVDNILAYARVTDVTDVYSFEHQAPAELVDDVLQEFRHQLVDGDFELDVDVPTDLPLVHADRTAMRLVLDNLVDNAIRYSSEQRWIRLAVWCDGSHVIIEVRDRGIGIPRDELSSVHRKFVRGQLSRSGGSGLGLAIVNRVVADHGGRFVLESEAGTGTAARFSLPAVRG